VSYPEYEQDVLRTLSLKFNLQQGPGGPFPTAFELKRVLKQAVQIGHEVDQLKRSIFYGSHYAGASEEFQETPIFVGKDSEKSDHPTPDMLHSALGVFTEAAEFLEAILASTFEGNEFDETNAIEELGDLEWYMAVMRQRLRVSQEKVQRINIAKLRARYPQKFASADALERDHDNERSVLESASD
jgi:NTP pyrophosphatase (non-canonical NTP hydrolase)